LVTLHEVERQPVRATRTATDCRPLIYLAGPYTEPDPVQNTHRMIRIADALLDAGFVPLIPHLTLAWHLVSPKRYETWLDYDRQLLCRCDAVLRVPGFSNGATRETQYADELGIPVIRPWSADPGDCVAAASRQFSHAGKMK
jgi:nucleoside 2-deoxyribosyltransferase